MGAKTTENNEDFWILLRNAVDGANSVLVFSRCQGSERGDEASAWGGAIAMFRRSNRTAKSAILTSCQH